MKITVRKNSLKMLMAIPLLAVAFAIITPAKAHAASYANSHVDLPAGTTLTSDSGQFSMVIQTDGNLVTHFGGRPYWSTGTNTSNISNGWFLAIQGDGNMVIYRPNGGGAAWATGTSDPSGAQLRIQNDGNLVLVGNSRGVLWASNAAPIRLYSGQSLNGDRSWAIYSPDFRYRMVMQPDANVVLYDRNTPIWSKHGGADQTPGTFEMQTDGNLVLYGRNHLALWATNQTGPNGSYLEGQNDGNFVVYTPTRGILWSTRGDTTPDVGGGGSGGLIGGSDRDLAQKIMASGRVTGDSRYIGQIQAYANGNYGCHINPTILSVIYTTVAPASAGGLNHTVYISSLNRYCTGVLTDSGTASYHYRNSGGHAVDFAKVDGVSSTGWNDIDINLVRQLMVRVPSGSGFGQSNCRADHSTTQKNLRITMPAGIRQFSDTCNHNHIEVPVR
ncbi:MAG TPA: hypothetical protein VLF43_04325 [Candidatus Saccharimonadales bacterium]|nr:hypothetical protein [Candidatus Saccharimonadales bacterium]